MFSFPSYGFTTVKISLLLANMTLTSEWALEIHYSANIGKVAFFLSCRNCCLDSTILGYKF